MFHTSEERDEIQRKTNLTPLHLCETVDAAESLIRNDPELLNKPDSQGRIPAHIAAGLGKIDLVRYYISKGIDINSSTNKHKTLLHYAVLTKADCSVLELLLLRGADLSAIDTHIFCTPLHYAVMFNNFPAVLNILRATKATSSSSSPSSSSSSSSSSNFSSAATSASDLSHVIGTSCNAVSLMDATGRTPLHYAALNNNEEIAGQLLEHNSPVNVKDKWGNSALHIAAALGNRSICKMLIQRHANMTATNRQGLTPFHLAAAAGHLEIVHDFVIFKIPINASTPQGNTALFYAAAGGHLEIIRLLTKIGAEAYSECQGKLSPLHVAASFGHLSCAKLLVEMGANVTVEDEIGQIPLHKAARYGHISCIEFLLRKAPFTVKYVDRSGLNSMQLASLGKFHHCMEALLQREASSTKMKDSDGRTPMHWAACSGHYTLVRDLALKGAAVDPLDKDGRSPLHWAISSSSFHCVNTFLELNTNPTLICRKDGNSVLHYAAMIGNPDILDLLLQKLSSLSYPPSSSSSSSSSSPSSSSSSSSLITIDLPSIINSVNNLGLTPLQCAVERGFSGCIDLLLSHKASAVAFPQKTQKLTLLHIAVQSSMSYSFSKPPPFGEQLSALGTQRSLPIQSSKSRPNVLSSSHDSKSKGSPIDDSTCDDMIQQLRDQFISSRMLSSSSSLLFSSETRRNQHYRSRPKFVNISETINLLLQKAKLNAHEPNELMETPLHIAVCVGDFASVAILLRNDCDPLALTVLGDSCFHLACQYNHPDILLLLLDSLRKGSTEKDNIHSILQSQNFCGQSVFEVSNEAESHDCSTILSFYSSS